MSNPDFDPRIVSLDGDSGEEIISVLSSDTTRDVYTRIREQPATPKAIAEELELSLQNVHYHLSKIQNAGLVEANDIEYSEKGREMAIYEPAHDELIICGDRDAEHRLKGLLKRFLGGTGVSLLLAAVSHLMFTRVLGVGPSISTMNLAGGGRTPVRWWEFPSVWVLFALLLCTVGVSLCRFHRARPADSPDS